MWVAELADFHFNIKYRPGKSNSDTDALSRMPLDVDALMRECTEELLPNTVTAAIQAIEVQENSFTAASVTTDPENMLATAPISPIPKEQLRETQKADQVICPVLEFKLSGSKPAVNELRTFSPQTKCLFREWDKLNSR